MTGRVSLIAAITLAAVFTAAVRAEVTNSIATVDISVQQFYSDSSSGDPIELSDQSPSGDSDDTLRVVGRIIDNPDSAAAVVAAQYLEPSLNLLGNPQSFAVDLALSSADADTWFEGEALITERRTIVYGPLEALQLPGANVDFLGTFFVDGVLAVLGDCTCLDLTGAQVKLTVTVTKSPVETASMSQEETVFEGSVTLAGAPAGDATVSAAGDFPTSELIITDLSDLGEDFEAVHLLVIPSIQVDYDYSAIVDEPFVLTATLKVEAANLPDGTAVAAVIGAPLDSLSEAISITQNSATAQQLASDINTEWKQPTGKLAFADVQSTPLITPCGALGLESALGFLALGFMKFGVRRRYVG